MKSYTGKFSQVFTSGKFEGITMDPQTITFPEKSGFDNWVLEINRRWTEGKLNYCVAVL